MRQVLFLSAAAAAFALAAPPAIAQPIILFPPAGSHSFVQLSEIDSGTGMPTARPFDGSIKMTRKSRCHPSAIPTGRRRAPSHIRRHVETNSEAFPRPYIKLKRSHSPGRAARLVMAQQ